MGMWSQQISVFGQRTDVEVLVPSSDNPYISFRLDQIVRFLVSLKYLI